ncbi:hypothetical protein BO221_34260 [Archangium sp. Cb G35]|uniref:hypothetical protein n=1 Tax=Archangium sp. Cb G35 TaxID=1920190 RepID=UPI00093707C2|nr:hypothetical protein [Archangium sp. Cb G35]OJT19453.1 hypothetical protein BO221_34260 [Archangium sp. Cb G35]
MTKTKLLLAGLLAGAVAFGTGCKTDKGAANTNTGTDTSSMPTDAGTGGAGADPMDREREEVDPLPQEGTREMEPGVHDDIPAQPGTGGTGLEPEPMDRANDPLGDETTDEPLGPGAPANQPVPNEDMNDTERSTDPMQ